jgi:single-stranded-DNA-specific exonuclease
VEGRAALVLGQGDWNHGIVGIVAGRLADEFGLPTVVIGFEGDVGRGSVRGPAGFPLYDAVSACAEHLVRFGGHQAAAGVTVELRALDDLRLAFDAACRALRDRVETKAPAPGLTLEPGDKLADVLADLWLLEPCGAQNPLPMLEVEGTVREARSVRGGHLKLSLLLPSGATLHAFGPNLGERGADLRGQVRLSGELRPDRHRGGDAVELLIRSLAG